MQMPMSAAEHLANCPADEGSGHSPPWFDFHVVVEDAAALRIVEQGAFVSPDTVPPTGGGLTKAGLVGQGDQVNAMTVDRDEAKQQLPKHRSTYPPRFGVEVRTVRWVGHPDEGRKFPVHAADGGHRRPDL
jgi:hypothetical protein